MPRKFFLGIKSCPLVRVCLREEEKERKGEKNRSLMNSTDSWHVIPPATKTKGKNLYIFVGLGSGFLCVKFQVQMCFQSVTHTPTYTWMYVWTCIFFTTVHINHFSPSPPTNPPLLSPPTSYLSVHSLAWGRFLLQALDAFLPLPLPVWPGCRSPRGRVSWWVLIVEHAVMRTWHRHCWASHSRLQPRGTAFACARWRPRCLPEGSWSDTGHRSAGLFLQRCPLDCEDTPLVNEAPPPFHGWPRLFGGKREDETELNFQLVSLLFKQVYGNLWVYLTQSLV